MTSEIFFTANSPIWANYNYVCITHSGVIASNLVNLAWGLKIKDSYAWFD